MKRSSFFINTHSLTLSLFSLTHTLSLIMKTCDKPCQARDSNFCPSCGVDITQFSHEDYCPSVRGR
ncbi:hypothetical protein BC941DRAFT_430261 [Chlamydoabsidia padenii]|nr:hypothetical protein BC941DRAFT_430261 [Chlamydoabsidia padenii]